MEATPLGRSGWPGLLWVCSGILSLTLAPAAAQINVPQRPVQVSEPEEPGTGLPEQPPVLPEAEQPQAPSPTQAPPPKYDFQHNITGDWFGLRNWLSDQGIEITCSYVMEYLGNPVGGSSQGSTYVHNIGLRTDIDLEKLVGLPNSAFRARFSQRSGDSLTSDHIHNQFNVQQIYGAGQTYRLVDVQLYHSFFDNLVNVTYGKLVVTADFLTSPLYCQFVNNAYCGQPTAPSVNMPNGNTTYPRATYGGRIRLNPTSEFYGMVGVYDGDPEQEGRNDHGTNFTLGDNGYLVVTEIGYTPWKGLFDLPGHYKLGGFYHSGTFPNLSRATVDSMFSPTRCFTGRSPKRTRACTPSGFSCSPSISRRIRSPTSSRAAWSIKACSIPARRTKPRSASPSAGSVTTSATPDTLLGWNEKPRRRSSS